MKIADFKIEEWMNKYEASAKYDLTTTCIKPLSLNELCKNIPEEILNTNLTYGDITGSERLKIQIKSLYENQNQENITITHGAIGANQLIFLSLLEQEDEVVTLLPVYQQHYSIPESLGAKVKQVFLKEDNQWLPDLEELAKIITNKTKLLCINNPNNPTGAVIPDNMLEGIAQIAQKHDTWILSDEVYRGLNVHGNSYSKSIADIYDKGISVGSMSKTYSLPGLRVGWIVADKYLIENINRQRQYNTISVSILDDYFASLAIEKRAAIAERNFKVINTGLEILSQWVKNEDLVECIIPKGGTTALVRYKKDILSAQLCRRLQECTGVAILPGETMEMEGYLRIGFCADNLQTALNLFSDFLHNKL